MKRLRFEFENTKGILRINALSTDHTKIRQLIETKLYYDGDMGSVKMSKTKLVFNISPLAQLSDMEALLEEIKAMLGISDEDVV